MPIFSLREIRRAVRSLRRERAFTLTVVATLAVIIAANVAIFSVIEAVLLQPLPYDEPDEIVTLYNQYPGAGVERASNGSFDYFARRERIGALEEVALIDGWASTIGGEGSVERVPTLRVTPSLFPLLRVEAQLGRTFTDDEMDIGNEFKVLLTHDFWAERFQSNPAIVGEDMRVDGRPYTVVGVLPEGFRMVGSEDAKFFLPTAFDAEDRTIEVWHSNSYSMLGRLKEGATIEQVQGQVDALNQTLVDEWAMPNARQLLDDTGFRTAVLPTVDDLVEDVRPTLFMLWAGVIFVLLIGCVNIANLMLGRAQNRLGEVATRLALGAPRSRVAADVLVESVLLAVTGGVLGLVGGIAGLRLLETIGVEDLPRGVDIGIDGTVVLFTVGVTLATALLFAMAPIVSVLRRELSSVFRSEGRNTTAGRGSTLLRTGLATSQVALAFVLSIGAGLMLMSFRAALSVEPGFTPDPIGTAFLSLPPARYADDVSRRNFQDRLLRDLEGMPGLESASLTSQVPFSGNNSSSVVLPEGYIPPPGESIVSPYQSWVAPDYFETMGIRIVEGRGLEWGDDPEGPRYMVVDETLARRYWPDSSPIGHRMLYGVVPGQEDVDDDDYYTVVGVVETIKQNDLTSPETDHVGAFYLSSRVGPPTTFGVITRAADGRDPATLTSQIRETVTRLDPELPLANVLTMSERIDESLNGRRAPMTLLIVFSGVALFLAAIGIYGTLAYAVARRRQEMGIRMALGSATTDIFRLVIGSGGRVMALGLGIGLVASIALSRLIQSLLFGVTPLNPAVLATVGLVLGGVGLAACAVPALRAMRIDPITALAPE